MSKFRKIIAALCLVVTLGYAAIVLLEVAIPPRAENYASIHSLGELPPIMCFAPDSVLNVGSAEELDAFPDIGEVLSQRIIDYREIWGDYRIPEDLTLVKGIGEKRMNGMMAVLEEELVPKYPGE